MRWSWSRGLLSPQPRWTTPVLSRWLHGESAPGLSDSADDEGALTAVGSPSEPVHLAFIPRTAGMLIGSMALIALATALALSRPGRRFAIAVTTLLAVAVLAAVNPAVAGAIFVFAQPGILMLIPLAAAWFAIDRRLGRSRVFQSIR